MVENIIDRRKCLYSHDCSDVQEGAFGSVKYLKLVNTAHKLS